MRDGEDALVYGAVCGRQSAEGRVRFATATGLINELLEGPHTLGRARKRWSRYDLVDSNQGGQKCRCLRRLVSRPAIGGAKTERATGITTPPAGAEVRLLRLLAV